MSDVLGIRLSSMISTPTSHPDSVGSTEVAPIGCLPVKVAMYSTARRTAAGVVSSLSSTGAFEESLEVAMRSPLLVVDAHRTDHTVDDLLLQLGFLLLGDLTRGPRLADRLQLASSRCRVVHLLVHAFLDDLGQCDHSAGRCERQSEDHGDEPHAGSPLRLSGDHEVIRRHRTDQAQVCPAFPLVGDLADDLLELTLSSRLDQAGDVDGILFMGGLAHVH